MNAAKYNWRKALTLEYGELVKVARAYTRRESIEAEELVHEAVIRLLNSRQQAYNDRQHFLATMARIMRCVLVDQARKRGTDKRGGHGQPEVLDEMTVPDHQSTPLQQVQTGQALEQLKEENQSAAAVVMLRIFGGFTEAECARTIAQSLRSVQRHWMRARHSLSYSLSTA